MKGGRGRGTAAFAAALRDPGLPPPADLVAPAAGPDVAARFAIYRANHRVSLREALAAQFPVCRQLVGDAFFDAVADAYVAVEPPRTAALHGYGAGFAEFLAGFPPCAELDYLPGVARIEFAWRSAWGAADLPPLGAGALAGRDPAALLEARVVLHPAARLLRSAQPCGSIWLAHQGEGEPDPPAHWQPEAVLLRRPAFEVSVEVLGPDAADLLERLAAGATLGAAADAATPGSDPGADFALLLERGVFAAIIPT